MWNDLVQDVSFALRSLRKTPGFAVIAIVTLALGVGANTAIFSVINSVLLRPLPYRDADRLVFIWATNGSSARGPLSPARFLDFRDGLGSVSAAAGICQFGVILAGGGPPEQIDASSVSSSFFDVLGARPLVGDVFHANTADDRAVVLSHGLWVRRFGSDPGIVGRDITINGARRQVVAVMRQDFGWPGVTGGSTGGSSPGAVDSWRGAGHPPDTRRQSGREPLRRQESRDPSNGRAPSRRRHARAGTARGGRPCGASG